MFIEKTPCLVYDLLVLIDFIFNKLLLAHCALCTNTVNK